MTKSSQFRLSLGATLAVGFLTALGTANAHAAIPTNLEPEYFDAVLSYNGKKFPETVAKIDALLKKSPGQVEFLQLKALALKSSGKEKDAAAVYAELVNRVKKPKEAAPYHFELGVIRYKENKFQVAREHLREAASQGFNEGAASFFLGNMAFKEGSLPEADEAFSRVLSSDANDLKPIARFYLGQIAMKTGNTSAGVSNFVEARNSAREMAESSASSEDVRKVAMQIQTTTQAALAPLDRASWFGTVSLGSGYDSNVLAVPESVGQAGTGALQTGSPRGTFGASFGYLSSPLKLIQFVPSYRTNMTYNTYSETQTGNSWAHQLSLYVTRKPLASTSVGAKLEGSYLFQNVASESGTGSSLKPYSFTGVAGPYVKTHLGRNNTLGAEVTFGLTSNFLDDQVSDSLKRSGTATQGRVFYRRDTGSRVFNPGLALALINNGAKGTEWKSTTASVELTDQLTLSPKWTGSLTASYALSNYSQREPSARNDKTLSLGAGVSRKFTPNLSGAVDLQYTNNTSNVPDTYQYKRWVSSLGATYGF